MRKYISGYLKNYLLIRKKNPDGLLKLFSRLISTIGLGYFELNKKCLLQMFIDLNLSPYLAIFGASLLFG